MKIIIYTSFDCLIKADNEEEVLSENENLTLEKTPSRIYVYPINKGRRPSFEIDINNKASNFYRIIEKDDKTLVFLLDGIFTQNYKVQTVACKNKTCQIEIGKNEVSFSCESNKKVLNIAEEISTSHCGSFYHIAFAKIQTNSLEYLIAYNTKTYQAKIIKGKEISLTQQGFNCKYSSFGYKDICEEYVFTEEGLKIKERTFSSESLPFASQTLCWRFMDSIKKADYSSAYKMLSPTLQNKISISSLKDYFGTISYFFPLSQTSFFAISNGQNNVYDFSLNNSFIEEISDGN